MAAGLMGTEVESITLTVNTNSIVASPMNVVSDDYEVTVLDYNLDEITFRLDYDWYIEDGEICRVQFQVAELAPVAGSSNLEISDVSYNSEARVDETEMVNGRIMVEAGEMDWMVWMEFTTSGMLTDDIYIGANPEATDMYDDALDMLNDPPTSWFDPYSDISGFDPGNPQLDGDIRNSYNDVITWTIPVGDSAGKIEWDFRDEDTLLAMGSLFLNGVIDMKTASVYYFDPGETVTIVYRRTGESPFDIHMYPGWNMVSLPLVPSAMESTPDNVYPDASYVYGFDTATNNWVEAENIVPGVGYMVLVTTEVDYTLWGQPVNDYTFDIIRGWNLIGTVYDEADFSSPTSSPPGAVMGSPEHTYYYNVLGGGYDSGDVLEPGKGYFVAANVDAVLSVPGVAGGKAYLGDMQEEFQLDLTIDGQSYALAIGSSNSNCVRPLPPTIGDMQYAAYLSVNDWQANAAYFEGSSEFDLVVNGRASILVNSKSDNSDAAIVVNGQQIPLQGEINLPCAGSYKIIYGDLPTAFKLYGNVPNPFNATTRIAFDLPTDSEVKLEVFDLLGKKVSSLIDGQVAAGSHSMTWNGLDDSGRETPSGIYYYRIKTDSHEDTRRMLLLK